MSSSVIVASSNDPSARVPRLASVSSRDGVAYAQWRPQMQTFLMRQGVEQRDYMREIAQWKDLAAAVASREEAEENEAFASILAHSALSNSGVKVKDEPALSGSSVSGKKTDAMRVAEAAIARSRKAYGYLYAALSSDLRLLVADVPQGYAYGIWSFLEKRFRNTEQDSVMALWKSYTSLQQADDETFDEYKARVDSVLELLVHARQTTPPELYASLLLWNLQPKYSTAVLTLKTSERLKDPAKIDWKEIAEFMAQYERSQHGLGETNDTTAERAMAARGNSPSASSSGYTQVQRKSRQQRLAQPRPLSEVECFNCGKRGHYRSECRAPRKAMSAQQAQPGTRTGASPRQGGQRSVIPKPQRSPSPSVSDESESEEEGKVKNRANMAQCTKEISAVIGSDYRGGYTYCARVIAGLHREQEASMSNKQCNNNVAFAADAVNRAPAAPSAARQTKLSLETLLKTKGRLVDSAATQHITGDKNCLVNLRRCAPYPVKMADNTVVIAQYKGDLPMRLAVAGKPDSHFTMTFKDVYYHERFDATLLSWGGMREGGWKLNSDKDGTYLTTPGGKKVKASTRGRLTILEDAAIGRAYAGRLGKLECKTAKDLIALHHRLGHASWHKLVETCQRGNVDGVADITDMSTKEMAEAKKAINECTACAEGKTTRNAVGHRGLDKGSTPGEVIHMDTFHVVQRNATTKEKTRIYVLLATDSYTGWRWAYHSSMASTLSKGAVDILQHSHTTTGRHPRLLISDLGPEFENHTLERYCRQYGIKTQPSPTGVKELNGVAEKSVDTVKNHARTILRAAGIVDRQHEIHAVTHHIYLWNRLHVSPNTKKTPYEMMYNRQPSVLHVGVFGCDAYVTQTRPQRDTTFSPKALPGIYLGHDGRLNCAKVLMLRDNKVILSKDVQFREGAFTHLRALEQDRADEVPSLAQAGTDTTESEPITDDEESISEDASHPSSSVNDEEESVDAPQQTWWRVRSIVDARTYNGIKEYQVKWVGSPTMTWEPATNIQTDAPEAVSRYEEFLQNRSQARVTRSRTSETTATPSSSSAAHLEIDDEVEESSVQQAALEAASRL